MPTTLRRGRTGAGLALLGLGWLAPGTLGAAGLDQAASAVHGDSVAGAVHADSHSVAGAAATAPPGSDSAAAADPTAELVPIVAASGAVDLAWRTGDPALFVVEQAGRILRFADGQATPVLDISGDVSTGSEQGLLGLAFAPAGDVAYIDYTDTDGDTVVAAIPVSADGTTFDLASARTVLTVEQPYANHNGGDLAIGPGDGLLYIGLGDGGSGGDPDRRALDLSQLLGKLLRIDPTTPSTAADGTELGYTIPADNPFVGVDGARGEIWSLGLRNPWRFSFDADNGDLWIADVGQNAVEEVDVAPATDGADAGRGANFGWSAWEGDQPYNTDQDADGAIGPIAVYGHEDGRCSISGGVRARGEGAGTLAGWYVFADYCSGEVLALEPSADLSTSRTITLAQGQGVTAVVSGPGGEVFVLDATGVNQLTA